MTWTPFSPSVRRWTVEPMLAVLTVTLTAVWVTEPGFVFDGGIDATIVDLVFIPATLLVPGLLAVSVLARVVRHGVRVASAYVGSDKRAVWCLPRLLRSWPAAYSVCFSLLEPYCLGWDPQSVIHSTDFGGFVEILST